MPYSMTGVAQVEETKNELSCLIEVRSVNHRYLNLSIKLPRELCCFEQQAAKLAKKHLSRGKVDIFLQAKTDMNNTLILNPHACRQLEEKRKEVRKTLGYKVPPLTMKDLQNMPECLSWKPQGFDYGEYTDFLLATLEKALLKLRDMQNKEGVSLQETIQGNCEKIKEIHKLITDQQDTIQKMQQAKLEERLWNLLGKTKLDKTRLYQEIGYLLEHTNIQEELDRLWIHIEHLQSILAENKPVGRKLDFICQELAREANTICSKVNCLSISESGIELKCEIEKIREQVQNIE